MNLSDLPAHSRIWVYQANRPFTAEEATNIRTIAENFVAGWASHGNDLRAAIELKYDQFIVVAVDEQQAMASGCSIDKSVHLMQELEKQFDIKLFDRMLIAYRDGDSIKSMPMAAFGQLLEDGTLGADTIVFNNLVKDKGEFDAGWEGPVSGSWHKQLLPVTK